MTGTFSLMIHGGAGEMDHVRTEQEAQPYYQSMQQVLEQGRGVLQHGGTALDAVELCVALLENDPLYNAGRGSSLNVMERVEMDAAIMDGSSLAAGAVAGVMNLANPIRLARRVLSATPHVMLAGAGAMQFAREQGFATVAEDYLVTERRREEYAQARAAQAQDMPKSNGTVGAVARDQGGNLAAATSTGGTVLKKQGRVGDSPIIGAGVYADSRSCAVSTTGHGEAFMRTVLAKHIADLIEFRQLQAGAAAQQSLAYLDERVGGRGGVIVIDQVGRCAARFNTRTMACGWIEQGAAPQYNSMP